MISSMLNVVIYLRCLFVAAVFNRKIPCMYE